MKVEVELSQEDVAAIKKKSGEVDVKGAIAKAIGHFLNCERTGEEDVSGQHREPYRAGYGG